LLPKHALLYAPPSELQAQQVPVAIASNAMTTKAASVLLNEAAPMTKAPAQQPF
jgi:hypothetical protein